MNIRNVIQGLWRESWFQQEAGDKRKGSRGLNIVAVLYINI
jgi:hypothetical protein